MYIYIHIWMYVCKVCTACMYVRMDLCMHVCLYVCMYVCMCVCMCVYACMCACMSVYVCIHTHSIYKYRYIYTCSCMNIHVYIYVYTYVKINTQISIFAQTLWSLTYRKCKKARYWVRLALLSEGCSRSRSATISHGQWSGNAPGISTEQLMFV